MTSMKNYKSLVKQTFLYITRALSEGYTLNRSSKELRKLVNSYPGLTRNERYYIYREAYVTLRAIRHYDEWEKELSKRKHYDNILRVIRKADKNVKLRAKKAMTRASLNSSDNVFFMCSIHNKCRKLHKPYQGQIFVDRFWRSKVSGKEYYSVLSYIKNHKTMTVQEAMQEPIWLVTADYCKHYFIPLNTSTVLHNSARKIAEGYRKTVKKYTAEEYYSVRSKVYEAMDKMHPCKEFKKFI